MRKTVLFLFLFTLFFFSLFYIPYHIQAAQEAWNFQELHYKRCIQEPADKINAFCPPFEQSHVSSHWEHRVQISLEDRLFSPNSFIYIVECLEIGEDIDGNGSADPICTTGNSQLDKTLFCGETDSPNSAGCDRYSFLSSHKDILYSLDKTTDYGQFHIVNGLIQRVNPAQIRTNSAGKPLISAIEWQSYTKMDARRSYMAIYPYTPPTATPSKPPTYQKGIGGMQQDIINTFPTSTPTPTPAPVRTAWDPRGRVFDTNTLEPIAIGSIVLKQKQETGVFDAGYATIRNPLIFNPFPMENSGVYIFYVENGEYTLEPRVAGYRHPSIAEIENLHPNAKRIYTSQLYLNDSPAIIEKGSIEYRDIPLIPLTARQPSTEIKVYSEKEEVNDAGDIVYSGYISHPYAEIDIQICHTIEGYEQCTNKKTYNYKDGGPDNEGNFSIILNQKELPAGYYFIRSFRKVDLRTLPLSFKIRHIFISVKNKLIPVGKTYAVQASKDRATIDPIPRYIEGFLADTNADTIVEIRKSGYTIPSYSTTAETNGFISIPSNFLPREPYTLVSVKNDTTTTIRTSEFLASNREYITSNEIEPYKESKGKSQSDNITPFQQQNTLQKQTGKPNNPPTPLLTIFITLVFAITGAIAYYYYMKKRDAETIK